MDPPTISQSSDNTQDQPMDIKMECDDVTEEDYFSTSTMETTDVTTDTDNVKSEVTLPIKMAPPEESMTLEDFVSQETARQRNPMIATQLEGPVLHNQRDASSHTKLGEPDIGMPQVDRSIVPPSMSLPVALPPGPIPLLADHVLSDTGMTSDTSVLTKVDAPQTKNTLLKQIIDKACLKLAREGEESLFLSVNIEKKLCSFVGTETGRQFLTKRPDIMEHFFQFCQAVYKARGDLVTTETTSSTGEDSDFPSSPKKSKPESMSVITPENKTEVSKEMSAGHPMTRSQSKVGKAQTVQENKKSFGKVQSSRPSRKRRGQHNLENEKRVKVEPSVEMVSEAQSDLEMECEGPIEDIHKADPLKDPDILKLSKDLDNTDASWDTHLQNVDSGKLVVFNVTNKQSDSSAKDAKKDKKINGSDESILKSPKQEIHIKKESVTVAPCSMPCFPVFEKCSSSVANSKGLVTDSKKGDVSNGPNSPNKAKNYEILTDLLDQQNPNIASPYILSVPTLQNANAPIVKQETSASTYKSPSRRRTKDGKKPKICHRYSREERDEIAEYAIKHGLTKSADHFNKLWNMKLTPSTIFYFRKTYLRDKKNEESIKEEVADSKGGNCETSNGTPHNMYSYEKKTARKSINSPNRRKPKTKLDEAEKVLQEMELKQKILKICSMEKKNADSDSVENSSTLKENSDTGKHLLNVDLDMNQGENFLVYNAESMESVWTGEDAVRQNFALEMAFPNNHVLHPKYCILPAQKDADSSVLQKPISNTDQLGINDSDFTSRRDEEIIIEGLKDPDLTQSLPNTKHHNGTTNTSPNSDVKTSRVSRRKNTPRKALATSFPIEVKEFTKEEEIEIAKYALDHSLQDTATFFQILWNVHLDTDTVKVFKENYLHTSQEEREITEEDSDSCFTYVL